jgi:hypothetical protein
MLIPVSLNPSCLLPPKSQETSLGVRWPLTNQYSHQTYITPLTSMTIDSFVPLPSQRFQVLETRRSPGQEWIPAPRFIAKNGSGTAAPDGYGAALTGRAAPTPTGRANPPAVAGARPAQHVRSYFAPHKMYRTSRCCAAPPEGNMDHTSVSHNGDLYFHCAVEVS